MSDADLFVPKYLSENFQIGDSYVLRKKCYSLADEGDTVTLLAVEKCSSGVATSGGFYQDGLLFVFLTPKGIKKIEAPKFGTFDHTFLSLLCSPVGE